MENRAFEKAAALRRAAERILSENAYQWGHMGACNCGFLAQEITHCDRAEIHRAAMNRSGDWRDQLRDYCPGSGLAMDEIMDRMHELGFSTQDLINLERLEDSRVRRRMKRQDLRFNQPGDVASYMLAWADLIEEQWAEAQPLPQLSGELVRV